MLRQCLLAQLLSARCCCVTAAKLALLALPGPERALGPERAASAIFRGLPPKDAPN